MRSVWCGTCRKDYNFPGTEYPSIWIDRHIAEHEREFKTNEEDYQHMRDLKPLHSKADILNKAHQMINQKDSK